jgi:ABC-2 type transport system ATP-binding protein
MTAAIEASGLTRRFGSTRAVDGVDLVADGGVVGLLGPNGSGKTTLLRMLATVLAPQDGSLRLLGFDPGRASERIEIRRRLGYLPQDVGLYRGFTAYELVDYVAVLKEMTDGERRRDEVRRVLEAVDLADVMHKKIRALSGGMRQRVALASAMLGSPRLLVLDEPAAGLDPEQRLRLRSILSDAGRDGTVVLSTHHTDEVAALCHRVVVLLGGRVRFVGSPAELAGIAAGRVWLAEGASTPTGTGIASAWVTADGSTRAIGSPPVGVELVEPTIDDGYLLLTHQAAAR